MRGRDTLKRFPVHATVASIDLDRVRRWYDEKLGLLPEREDRGGAWYRFGGETWLYLDATPSAGTAKNTIAGLADFGVAKAAWFKDSEGNTYGLSEVSEVRP